MRRSLNSAVLIMFLLFITISCNDNSSDIQNGRIIGTIVDYSTNEPLANVIVTTNPASESVFTDGNGNYHINIINPGTYIVNAEKSGYYSNQISVKVVNNNTITANLVLRNILATNNKPNIPSNPNPANNSTDISYNAALSWECSDIDGDEIYYNVYLSKSDPPTELLCNGLTVTHIDNVTLDTCTKYYWRVVAKDIWGAITEGPIWTFTTSKKVTPPTTNLIAYWNFDDGTANDVTGNGYNGTLMNYPQVVQGIKGNALRFQGYGNNTSLGSHVLLPMINFNTMTEFSIGLWVKEEGWSCKTGGGGCYIFFGDIVSGALSIGNTPMTTNQADTVLYNRYETGSKFFENSPLWFKYNLSDNNQWIFYGMTYKNGVLTAYRNKNKIGEMNQTVNVSGINAAIARHWWYDGTETATRFIGSIDEVRIYNKALSQEEMEGLATP